MIEYIISEYLRDTLEMDGVYLEVPKKNVPDEFVVFQIVDRSRDRLIDAVTVELYSYGPTKEKAAQLDERVRGAMYDITGLDEVSASRLGGGNDAPDTTLKRYRYRSYFNLTYMEDY